MTLDADPQRGSTTVRRVAPWALTLLACVALIAVIVRIVPSAGTPVAARPPAETTTNAETGPGPSESQDTGDHRASLQLEEFDETLDPIALGDRRFTVVVHKMRIAWPEEAGHSFDPDDDETAVSFEVRDGNGRVVYHRSVVDDPREIELARIREDGRFSFSYFVRPYRLEGSSGSALMIDWYYFPSAPSACSTHAVLGIVGGELVPFGEPFCEILKRPDNAATSSGRLTREDGTGDDILEVESRFGYFTVVVPVRVDFVAGRLLPARRCLRLDESAKWVELCEFPVETHPLPRTAETVVRLFPRPDGTAVPRPVVVKTGSRVEFLSALAPNVFDNVGNPVMSPTDATYWLKVRIDEREGWVREASDLRALGLAAAG